MKVDPKNPEVFISHSWSSPAHKAWVIELAERLVSNGVLVRLDSWDLKEGHDVFYFMEQMVKNESISKVLVICDKAYKEKADERKGGVGIESQLISDEVYKDPRQEKFIPIIRERDEEGEPYLPNFMKNRVYIDLSRPVTYEQEYEKLIRNIHRSPINQRPPLGPIPSHIAKGQGVGDVVKASQSFYDVPPNAWYYRYVEQLVADGVIDPSDKYNPLDTMSRAELIKIVITAIDGLAGYEAPRTPTFDDVSVSHWYFDYIESAVQLGIISGYTDADDNLTGLFGPEDTASRQWATKVLVNSFSIPIVLAPSLPFTDVANDSKYYNYILTAYNQSVIDEGKNIEFRPTEPLTRALMAKWVVKAQNPVLRNG